MKIPYLLLIVTGLVIAVAVLAFAFLPNPEITGSNTPETSTEGSTSTDQTPSGGLSIRQPDEATMYNMGTTETVTAKDGSSVNVYTNNQLGISFSYPAELGEVKVGNDNAQISLSLKDQVTDENGAVFMALLKEVPTDGRDSYWGDIGYSVNAVNIPTFCATPSSSIVAINDWLKTATCERISTKGGLDAIHLSGSWSDFLTKPIDINVYVIPQQTDLYSIAVLSDEGLISGGSVKDADTVVASIVDSLTFSPLQPIYY